MRRTGSLRVHSGPGQEFGTAARLIQSRPQDNAPESIRSWQGENLRRPHVAESHDALAHHMRYNFGSWGLPCPQEMGSGRPRQINDSEAEAQSNLEAGIGVARIP